MDAELGFDLFDSIKLILNNRVRIWGCVTLKRARNDAERDEVDAVLRQEKSGEGKRVWEDLYSSAGTPGDWSRDRMRGVTESVKARDGGTAGAPRLQETIFGQMGSRAFITPGIGVDPTNEYRDEKQGATSHLRLVAADP